MKKDYLLNNFYVRKVRDSFVLTTDHGCWISLIADEFKRFESKDLDDVLFNKLEEKGIIITERNQDWISETFREKNNFLFQGPSLHIIILTLRCNMKCVYCHASSRGMNEVGFDMSEETASKVVDFIFQTPSEGVTIEFQGGEPLVNFNVLKHVVSYAKEINKKFKKDLRFNVVTNLSLMDKDKLDFLLKQGVSICTSLDGPKQINRKNRIFVGDDKLEFWIKEISKKDKNMINALPTVTKNNILYWKELVDEYVRLGLRNVHLRFLNNLGYAKKTWEDVAYSAEEFVDMWKRSMDYIFELNKKGVDIKERMAFIIASKFLKNDEPNYLELRSPCGAVNGQLAYNFDGSVFTCDEARMLGDDTFRIGDVGQKLKDVVQSDKSCAVMAASCNDLFCYGCGFKPYCGVCPVCNFTEQGSIIAKIPSTIRCKIYKAQFDYILEKILFDKDVKEILERWLTTP